MKLGESPHTRSILLKLRLLSNYLGAGHTMVFRLDPSYTFALAWAFISKKPPRWNRGSSCLAPLGKGHEVNWEAVGGWFSHTAEALFLTSERHDSLSYPQINFYNAFLVSVRRYPTWRVSAANVEYTPYPPQTSHGWDTTNSRSGRAIEDYQRLGRAPRATKASWSSARRMRPTLLKLMTSP